MATFQNDLNNNVQRTIDLTYQDYVQTNATRSILEDKMAILEAKLLEAQQLLLQLEQPVSFSLTSYEVLENPDASLNLVFTEIILEFAYSLTPTGLLFFAENDDTSEKVLIQLVDGLVLFEVNNVDAVMSARSPIVLCPGCWFRVIATR